MRIVYFLSHDITKNDGVTKKVADQVGEWSRQGHTVSVYCVAPTVGDSLLLAFRRPAKLRHFLGKLIPDYVLLQEIAAFEPDIVYVRYELWHATYGKIILRFPCVVEVNSLDDQELTLQAKTVPSIRRLVRKYSNRVFRRIIFRRVVGIVAVTKEIANHVAIRRFQKPVVVVPNGIDLCKYTILKRMKSDTESTQLFFVGSPGQPWHGVDHMERMALHFPDWHFHFVGMKKPDTFNCTYHGYLSQIEYRRVLENCHVCIGTMALRRNHMQEACPLKVREYLAYGFPVIIGYTDTAWAESEQPNWLLRVSEELPDMEMIRSFVNRNRDVVVPREEVERIDVRNVERSRLKFLSRFVAKRDGAALP